MMNKFPYLILVLALSGCSTTSKDRTADDFMANYHPSQEFSDLDTSLQVLEMETAALESSYNDIQNSILPHTRLANDENKSGQLRVFINENNVLIVNDTTMSRNDFSLYADRVLPELCNPVPTLSIDTKANYDAASWVLDEIYKRGCTNVKVE